MVYRRPYGFNRPLAVLDTKETMSAEGATLTPAASFWILQFEVYFTLPGALPAGLTVSVVAQLGAGAKAAHWKVDMYEFVGKDDWTNIGDLTGGERQNAPCIILRWLLDRTQQTRRRLHYLATRAVRQRCDSGGPL